MSEHSRLSPSSMERILACPGSAVDNPPDRGSEAAEEGTLAHTLAERVLSGDSSVEFPNDEMRQAVFTYVSYVRAHKSHDELKGVDHTNSQLFLEERIVSKIEPDHGGTIDALIVSDTHIHVNDFKYGVMPVNAQDNKQVLSYLALANEKYPGRQRFFGTIIQPRVYGHPMCVEFSKEQVETHALDVMLVAHDKTRTPGGQCRWCPLKQQCDAFNDHQKAMAAEVFDDSWPASKCLEIIEFGPVFADMVNDAKSRLRDILNSGERVPGWKLARSRGNRAWKDEDTTALQLELKGLSDDVIYNKKLVSPAQLEKFSKAYKPFVQENTHRPEKGIVAVEASSPLHEYDPNESTNIFEDIT